MGHEEIVYGDFYFIKHLSKIFEIEKKFDWDCDLSNWKFTLIFCNKNDPKIKHFKEEMDDWRNLGIKGLYNESIETWLKENIVDTQWYWTPGRIMFKNECDFALFKLTWC